MVETANIEAIDYYVQRAIEKGISLDDYPTWVNARGFEFASLGEAGRDYFHKISSTSSKYDFDQANKKFDQLVKDHNGSRNIESFFHYCTHDLNIPVFRDSNYTNGSARGNTPMQGKEVEPCKMPAPPEDEEKWLYDLQEVREAPPQEKIWSFIVKGTDNAFVASSEAGKSTLLLNLCIAIGEEKQDYLGFPIDAPRGRAIYVSTEDGVSQLQDRVNSMLKGKDAHRKSILFIIDSSDLENKLKSTLKEYPSDLVIIDTWGDLVGGKYDAETTRKTMGIIRKVCREYDSTPVYVHHTNKEKENIPDKSSVKGAGDFEQKCRVVMMLAIYRDHRWLCCVKGNPFSEDKKNLAYELSYDQEKQSFSRTGNTMNRIEIVNHLKSEHFGRPKTEIDFSIMNGEHLTNTRLVDLLMKENHISRATAQNRIKDAYNDGVLNKDSNGAYYEV